MGNAVLRRLLLCICAENEGISPKEAIAKSKELMQGQKWNAFGFSRS